MAGVAVASSLFILDVKRSVLRGALLSARVLIAVCSRVSWLPNVDNSQVSHSVSKAPIDSAQRIPSREEW